MADKTTNPSYVASQQESLRDREPARANEDGADFERGLHFWMVIVALGCTMFLTALEATIISAALPIITHTLGGASFIWVGSAYMLASTACIPLCGGLAHVFGRKSVTIASLALLTAGSAIAGAANSMNTLIAGRVVQGMGGGGITATSAIIISDIVPLRVRGVYNGYIGIAWAIGSSIGPVIGGAFAEHGEWRWVFYLNIPFCVVAALLIAVCLHVPTPTGTFASKLKIVDWIGIIIVMASSTSVVLALTWGGDQYAWSSAPVLATLIAGLVGLLVFFVYEARLAKNPLVPFSLMTSRTGLSGFLQGAIFPITVLAFVYSLPVYYQASKGASAIQSGVWSLGMALVIPVAGIVTGITIKKSGKYRVQLWLAWVLIIIGSASFISLKRESPKAQAIGLSTISAIGMGILFTGCYFPVLAPAPQSLHGLAMAFFMFLRSFAQVWGVTIAGSVLQNGLKSRIPAELLAQLPGGGASIIYAAIPLLPHLPADQRVIIETAFAESIQNVWKVMTGIAALGLLASLPMQALRLHTQLDDDMDLPMQQKDLSPHSSHLRM